MRVRHDSYPLQPDYKIEASLGDDGRLVWHSSRPDIAAGDASWLLEVDYRAMPALAEPTVTTCQGNTPLFTQYLERGQQGRRWINLTGISHLDDIELVARHCRLGEKVQLLGFANPDLQRGPVLIVAPHPDDAELAAYGLYQRLAERAWIVTLSAGERQKDLTKQYLSGLDHDRVEASRRKGWIRAWNSASTPMLAGIAPERLVMLGYFNDTLTDLVDTPDREIPQAETTIDDDGQGQGMAAMLPGHFRQWNRMALPSDATSRNRGDCLIGDLTHLLKVIQPATVVVTHLDIDPHRDHIAAARACAEAIRQAKHIPEQVLLYANHLRGVRKFPYGPPHAAATLWPNEEAHTSVGPWRFYSEMLPIEIQRQKAVAMDSMHDLRAKAQLEKRIKLWLHKKIDKNYSANYADHEYFRTHIKAHEIFAVVSGESFQWLP